MNQPTPQEIRELREKCRLTQTQAGELIHAQRITWAKWESGENKMHPAFWELFCIKTIGMRKS